MQRNKMSNIATTTLFPNFNKFEKLEVKYKMKRQSVNNAAFKAAHNLVRFSADVRLSEREACIKSAYSCPAIVRAGMQALGIKPLIEEENHNITK